MDYRIGFAGSVDLRGKSDICQWRKVARAIGLEIGHRGHIFVSGGCAGGLTEDVAIGVRDALISKDLDDCIPYRIISYLYENYPYHSIDFGQSIVCLGLGVQERRMFLASQIDVMITLCGGGGTESESEACDKQGTYVLPIGCAGGTSGEKWLNIYRNKPENYYKGLINDKEFNFLNRSINLTDDEEITKFAKRLIDLAEKIAKYQHKYVRNECSITEDKGIDIAVLCALRDPEFNSLLRNGWSWEPVEVHGLINCYKAEILINGCQKVIYASVIDQMGLTASAVYSTRMIDIFKPKYLVMTGIAAGYPDKTRLGDVIVANPVWDWGNGKWAVKDGKITFLPEPKQIPLDPILRNKFNQMADNKQILFKIKQKWPANSPEYDLSLKVGPVASGSAVLADGAHIEWIKKQNRKICAIEMETYSIYTAAFETPDPKPKPFSIKSVVDYANSSKSDDFHCYAAYTSVQVFTHFAEHYLFS
ncbi:MAG: hypothetical protein ACFFDN_22875 [Candidatus Hodarchaeota archaeon]